MKPSLFTLFKRGRYCHAPGPWLAGDGETDPPEARRAREERERFAAASMAFCFEYDKEFRNFFWGKVLRYADDCESARSSMEVEPKCWSDLLISSNWKGQRRLHVIECKINAELQPHQDPRQKAFFETGGYGHKLLKEGRASNAELHYTVLGPSEPLSLPPARREIKLDQVSWAELDTGFPKTPLAGDLAETLGRLGCLEFSMRTMKTVQVGAGFVEALKAVQVLDVVCARLGVGSRFYKDEFDPEKAGLGRWIKPPKEGKHGGSRLATGVASREHQGLYRVTNRDGWNVWFGYDGTGSDPKRFRGFRRVWLWCENPTRAKKIVGNLRKPLESVGVGVQDEGFEEGVTISPASSNSKQGDVDWFLAVLKAVSQLKV